MPRISNDIDDIYLTLAKDLVHAKSVNGTRELNNVKFVLNDIDNNIVSVRGISTAYLFGELLWYFTGRNDLEFISKFSKFWKHLSDDGKTANSAYGYIMMKKHGFNQINKIIQLLEKDPYSRRALININVPNRKVIETKDEPCTIALQFLIRNGKLNLTAMMRSNDIWLGTPYDVAFFTELQRYMAKRLNVKSGTYTHFVVSLHLYDRNVEDVQKMIEFPHSEYINFDKDLFHQYKDRLVECVMKAKKPQIRLLNEMHRLGIYKNPEFK